MIKFETTDFKKMYDNSWYTIVGAGGDLSDWTNGYTEMLEKRDIGTPKEWMRFTGKEINEQYNLVKDPYPDELNFIAFEISDLNINKLSIFKLELGDRWFNDIVDNNAKYEENDIDDEE